MADDKKPIPVNPGESTSSIRLGGTTLLGMLGSQAKPKSSAVMAVRDAVSMSGHDRFLNALGAKTGSDADMALEMSKARKRIEAATPTVVRNMYARGMTVYDEKHDCKVTIIKTNVAYTSKTQTPCHQVSAKNGSGVWIVKETKLKQIR